MTLFEEFIAFSKENKEKKEKKKKKAGEIAKKIAKTAAAATGITALAASMQMGGPQNLLKTPEQWKDYRESVKDHNQAKVDAKMAEKEYGKDSWIAKWNKGVEDLAKANKLMYKDENIFTKKPKDNK